MKRRFLSLLLVLTVVLSCCTTAFAYTSEEERAATELYNYALFRGKGTDINGDIIFDLDGSVTRGEAITMVIRLMGEEENTLNAYFPHPFTDAGWASSYVGYAYRNGITQGVSATRFGTSDPVTMDQFLTLVLRAMGYSDVDWKNPYLTADMIGLSYPDPAGEFDRGSMALICRSALDSWINGYEMLLIDTLHDKGVLYKWPSGTTRSLPTIPADGKITVSSQEEVDAALAAFGLTGRTDQLILTVPAGQQQSYTDYIITRIADLIPDAFGGSLMLMESQPNLIYVTVDYHDSGRIRAYLRGQSDTLSDTDRKTLEAARAVIASAIDNSMSDYEKVLALHDYLLDCTTYGFCDSYMDSFEAAGPLLYGTGVCDGYACAYQLLCFLADIECVRFRGEVRSGSHAWNQVLLDGQWYHVDVTWDDTGALLHEYFLISDSNIGRDHFWTAEPGQNRCPNDYRP